MFHFVQVVEKVECTGGNWVPHNKYIIGRQEKAIAEYTWLW